MEDFELDYKKRIVLQIDNILTNYGNYNKLTISELNTILRLINYYKRKDYNSIINELLDEKLCDLLENKLQLIESDEKNDTKNIKK